MPTDSSSEKKFRMDANGFVVNTWYVKQINFQGAGSTCDFRPNGDQLGRGMGHWIVKGGKSVFVEYAKP